MQKLCNWQLWHPRFPYYFHVFYFLNEIEALTESTASEDQEVHIK